MPLSVPFITVPQPRYIPLPVFAREYCPPKWQYFDYLIDNQHRRQDNPPLVVDMVATMNDTSPDGLKILLAAPSVNGKNEVSMTTLDHRDVVLNQRPVHEYDLYAQHVRMSLQEAKAARKANPRTQSQHSVVHPDDYVPPPRKPRLDNKASNKLLVDLHTSHHRYTTQFGQAWNLGEPKDINNLCDRMSLFLSEIMHRQQSELKRVYHIRRWLSSNHLIRRRVCRYASYRGYKDLKAALAFVENELSYKALLDVLRPPAPQGSSTVNLIHHFSSLACGYRSIKGDNVGKLANGPSDFVVPAYRVIPTRQVSSTDGFISVLDESGLVMLPIMGNLSPFPYQDYFASSVLLEKPPICAFAFYLPWSLGSNPVLARWYWIYSRQKDSDPTWYQRCASACYSPVKLAASAVAAVVSKTAAATVSYADQVTWASARVQTLMHATAANLIREARTAGTDAHTLIHQAAHTVGTSATTHITNPITQLYHRFTEGWQSAWVALRDKLPFAVQAALSTVVTGISLWAFIQFIRYMVGSASLQDLLIALGSLFTATVLSAAWAIVFRRDIVSSVGAITDGILATRRAGALADDYDVVDYSADVPVRLESLSESPVHPVLVNEFLERRFRCTECFRTGVDHLSTCSAFSAPASVPASPASPRAPTSSSDDPVIGHHPVDAACSASNPVLDFPLPSDTRPQGVSTTWDDVANFFSAIVAKEKKVLSAGFIEGLPKLARFSQALKWFTENSWMFVIWVSNQLGFTLVPTTGEERIILDFVNSWLPVQEKFLSKGNWETVFSCSMSTFNQVREMHDRMKQLTTAVMAQARRLTSPIIASFTEASKQIIFAFARSETFKVSGAERNLPPWIAFWGDKAKGKSVMAMQCIELVAQLCRESQDPYFLADERYHNDFSLAMVYAKQISDDFMDNYKEQPFFLADEFMATLDEDKRHEQAMFMQAANTNLPFTVFAADPKVKGTHFRADFLFTTSNEHAHNEHGVACKLTDHSAFESRKTLSLKVVVKDGQRLCQVTPIPGINGERSEGPFVLDENGKRLNYLTPGQVAYLAFEMFRALRLEHQLIPLPPQAAGFKCTIVTGRRTTQIPAPDVVPQGLSDLATDYQSRKSIFKMYFNELDFDVLAPYLGMHPWLTHHLSDGEYDHCVARFEAARLKCVDPDDASQAYKFEQFSMLLALNKDTSLQRLTKSSRTFLSKALVSDYVYGIRDSLFGGAVTDDSYRTWYFSKFGFYPSERSLAAHALMVKAVSVIGTIVAVGIALTALVALFEVTINGIRRMFRKDDRASELQDLKDRIALFPDPPPEAPLPDIWDVTEQSGVFKSGVTARRAPVVYRTTNVLSAKKPTPQVGPDELGKGARTTPWDDAAEAKLANNITEFTVQGIEGMPSRTAFCLGVFADVYMASSHTLRDIPMDAEVELGSNGMSTRRVAPWGDFLVIQPPDTCIDWDYPVCFFALRGSGMNCDLTKFFVDAYEVQVAIKRIWPSVDSTSGRAIIRRDSTTQACMMPEPLHECSLRLESMPNKNGLCGLPYYVPPSSHHPTLRIVGIHGAGSESSDTSFAHIVPLCVVQAVKDYYTSWGNAVPQVELRFDGSTPRTPLLVPSQVFCPGVRPLGEFPPGSRISIHAQGATSIVKTKLHPQHPEFPLRDAQGPLTLSHEPTRAPVNLAVNNPETYALNRYNMVKDKGRLASE
jgi:hypothetical protein